MNDLLHGFRHYADFSGRDRRGQFWGFILLTQLIGFLLLLPIIIAAFHIVADLFDLAMAQNTHPSAAPVTDEALSTHAYELAISLLKSSAVIIISLILCSLWWLITLLPTAAATARRLRDSGHSPWWVLPPALTFTSIAALIPGLTSWSALLCLVTLVLCCLPTAPEPKTEEAPPAEQ